MAANDYTVQSLIDRIALKAFTGTSGSLSSQQLVDLCNDSLRSYLVPLTMSLREEWWVGKTDISSTTDSNGQVVLPDTVAASLRTVAWNNAGIQCPLTRVEPENSFIYLAMQGQLPVGFELRGYTLTVLPKTPGIVLKITAMLRPAQMVLPDDAAELVGGAGNVLTLVSVPLAWQAATPTQVDIIAADSPFINIGTFGVSSLVGNVLTLTSSPSIPNGYVPTRQPWVSDVGTSPFASIPAELYPLLEQDVIVQLFGALGDKRLSGAAQRKKELEDFAKKAMAPRTQGNARPIVNPNAPGMRSTIGYWGGRR